MAERMTDHTANGTGLRAGRAAGTGSATGALPAWAAPALVFVAALALRVTGLGWAGTFDEFYHLLAGQGWLETGTFRIADGTYERAPLYTLMVAGLLWLGDGSPAVVRLLSALAGAGLIALLFAWVRHVAGPVAAWVAAGFGILWPEGIFLSQYVRFYTLHGLLFFAGAVAVFHATDPDRRIGGRAALGLGALAAFGLATHFTPLTAVGLAPLGLWAGLVFVARPLLARRGGGIVLLGLVAAGLVAAAALWALGPLREAWEMFRFAPDWAARWQNEVTYYHARLRDDYPSVWPLTLFAVPVAVAYRPRAGLFVSIMALGILALQSLGGMKALRYAYYGMPFLFAVWGIAAAALAGPALRGIDRMAATTAGTVLPAAWTRIAGRILLAAAAGLVLVSNRVLDDVATLLRDGPPPEHGMDWTAAEAPLAPVLAEADVVATSKELQALYHYGRADVIASASRLSELPEQAPFSTDPRTGLPVIGDAAAMARLMGCTADGLLLTPTVQTDTADAFLATPPAGTTLRRVDLPGTTGLYAVTWATARPGGDCGIVEGALEDGAGAEDRGAGSGFGTDGGAGD